MNEKLNELFLIKWDNTNKFVRIYICDLNIFLTMYILCTWHSLMQYNLDDDADFTLTSRGDIKIFQFYSKQTYNGF